MPAGHPNSGEAKNASDNFALAFIMSAHKLHTHATHAFEDKMTRKKQS